MISGASENRTTMKVSKKSESLKYAEDEKIFWMERWERMPTFLTQLSI